MPDYRVIAKPKVYKATSSGYVYRLDEGPEFYSRDFHSDVAERLGLSPGERHRLSVSGFRENPTYTGVEYTIERTILGLPFLWRRVASFKEKDNALREMDRFIQNGGRSYEVIAYHGKGWNHGP